MQESTLILIVDGNDERRDAFRCFFEVNKFKVIDTGDAVSALNFAFLFHPEVLICADDIGSMGRNAFTRILNDLNLLENTVFFSIKELRRNNVISPGPDGELTYPINYLKFTKLISKKVMAIKGKRTSSGRKDNILKMARELLSVREFHIFIKIIRGLSSEDIAKELRLSTKTVENHQYNITGKLNLSGRNILRHKLVETIFQ